MEKLGYDMGKDLASFRIADSILAEAWDNTPPIYIAAIKNAIAAADFHFGHSFPRQTRENMLQHAGYWQRATSYPAQRALILFSCQYAAAARLCAASILPLLCGLENVAAVCVGSNGPESFLLSTLEVCGVEDIYHIPAPPLFFDIFTLESRGDRVILLHAGDLVEIASILIDLNIKFYEEARPPRIYIEPSLEISTEMLNFLHGKFIHEALPANADAAFSRQEDIKNIDPGENIPLILTPGCESFWLYPNLSPQFFMCASHVFGVCPSQADDCGE